MTVNTIKEFIANMTIFMCKISVLSWTIEGWVWCFCNKYDTAYFMLDE